MYRDFLGLYTNPVGRFVNTFRSTDTHAGYPQDQTDEFLESAVRLVADDVNHQLLNDPDRFVSQGYPLDSPFPIYEQSVMQSAPFPKNRRNPGKPRPKRGKARSKPKSGQPRVEITQPGYPSVSQGIRDSSVMVSAPTSKSFVQRSGMPRLMYRPNGDCVINHREFIANLNGSVAFASTQIQINPGLNGSMPWLSRIANNFESYIFKKLRFPFETSASTGSTGSVILAVDYDPSDPAPTSKTQALSYRAAIRSAAWSPMVHMSSVEDISKRKTYFVRAGNIPPNEDICLYDTGNLFAITEGQADASRVGEIWVEYEILLMTPKTLSAGSGNSIWGQFETDTNASVPYRNGNLPATQLLTAGNPCIPTWVFTQPWQGAVSVDIEGTGLVFGSAQFTGTATHVLKNAQTNATGTFSCGYAIVDVAAGQNVQLTIGNTTITSGNVWFTQGTGAFN